MKTKSTVTSGEETDFPGVWEIRVAQGPVDWAIAHQMNMMNPKPHRQYILLEKALPFREIQSKAEQW